MGRKSSILKKSKEQWESTCMGGEKGEGNRVIWSFVDNSKTLALLFFQWEAIGRFE
jgi:hypothetical protein